MKKKLLIVLAIMLLLGIIPVFATNVIKDRNLKGHLNTRYMKPSRAADTPITKEDLKTLTYYKTPYRDSKYVNIYSFEGMQYAVNLISLHLNVDHYYEYYTQTYHFNLAPFTGLKKLRGLILNNVNISDQNLIDIGKITSLRGLTIRGGSKWGKRGIAYPTTLSGLSNLTNLTRLELNIANSKKNKIDVNAIKNFNKLERLILSIPFTSNYEILRNKPNLKNLNVLFYGIKDLRVFKDLVDFENRNHIISIFRNDDIYLESPYRYKPDYIDVDGTSIQSFRYNKNEILYEGNGVYKLKYGVEKARMGAISKNSKNFNIGFMLYRGKPDLTFKSERIEGSSRFQTALKISDKLYTSANTAIIVNANKFPDALTSTLLSKKLKAPILLSGKDEIPASVKLKMKKLGVKNVIIVGGNLVISDKLERRLKANYSVRRIGGRSRYETSELVANEISGNGLIVARGDHFADALTISSLALKNDYPIYLTKPNVLTNSTFKKIKRRRPASIFIAGGVNAVNTRVESKLKTLSNVTRLGGATRFETAINIAGYVDVHVYRRSFFPGEMLDIMIARSDDFADAMVAGPLAYKHKAPILLVDKKGVSPEVRTYLLSRKENIKKGYIVGGTVAVPNIIETSIKNLMK